MSEHREIRADVSQGHEPLDDDAGSELDSASGSDLNTIRCQGRVVTNGNQHSHVHHGARRPRVQCQPQDAAPSVAGQFRPNNNRSLP